MLNVWSLGEGVCFMIPMEHRSQRIRVLRNLYHLLTSLFIQTELSYVLAPDYWVRITSTDTAYPEEGEAPNTTVGKAVNLGKRSLRGSRNSQSDMCDVI